MSNPLYIPEICEKIFENLENESLYCALQVCKKWNEVISDQRFYFERKFIAKFYDINEFTPEHFDPDEERKIEDEEILMKILKNFTKSEIIEMSSYDLTIHAIPGRD